MLYAGDNNGLLHKFTGVFGGTPAEEVSTVTNIWPVVVSSRPLNVLTSPVFDDGSGQIFVSDNSGFLYRVDATVGSGTGGIFTTVALGAEGIDDAVILDATTSNVYVFVRLDHNGTGGRAGICNFSTGFLGGSGCVVGTNEAQVSSDNTAPATAFYDGDFDDAFYSSADGTGSLYACGTNAGLPALWLVPVTSGTLGTAVAGPTLATTNIECSPITEFKNGATDRMFVSVTANSEIRRWRWRGRPLPGACWRMHYVLRYYPPDELGDNDAYYRNCGLWREELAGSLLITLQQWVVLRRFTLHHSPRRQEIAPQPIRPASAAARSKQISRT